MAQRLEAQFTDDDGTLYKVKIYDSAYSGSVNEFTLGADGFILTYHGKGGDTHQPLIPSTCEFVMLEQSSADDSFLDDIADAPDQQIRISITRGTKDHWWVGLLNQEQVVRQDIHNPAPVRLRASCGLGRLKKIKFCDTDGTPYSGLSQTPNIIGHALSFLKTADFYGTSLSDGFLAVAQDFESPDYGAGINDKVANSRINNSTWTQPDKEGEDRYYSCYDVLTSICLAWNARLAFSDTRWYFMPVGTYRYDLQAKPITSFRKTGAFANDGVQGNRDLRRQLGSDLKRLRGWASTFLRPLKSVKRTQDFQGNVPVIYDYAVPNGDFPLTLSDQDRSYETGDKFIFQGTIQNIQTAVAVTGNARVRRFRLKMTIKCGSRYLKRQATFSGTALDFQIEPGEALEYTPHTYGTTSWTTNSADYYDIVSQPFDRALTQTPNTATIVPFTFTTPPLPDDQDHLDVTFAILEVDNTGSSTGAGTGFTGQFFKGHLTDDSGNGDECAWSSTADTESTEEFHQGRTLVGGAVTIGALGVIEVNTGGSVYAPTDNWNSQVNTSGQNINQLGVEDVLRMRIKAQKLERGELRGTILNWYEAISINSAYQIPIEMRITARPMITEFEGFRVTYDTSTTTTEEQGQIKDTRPPIVTGQGGGVVGAVEDLKGDITGVGVELDDVQADVETNTTAIAGVQADIATLTTDVANANSAISSNDTDIDDIQKIIKGDGGTDLGILSDTGDNTAAALLVQSTSAKIQGGNNTSISATQTSPGQIQLNVQAGATGSEAQVTAVQITGSSTVNTKATVSIQSGDFRINGTTQFNSGSVVNFQDTANFNGTTTGIDYGDLDNAPTIPNDPLADADQTLTADRTIDGGGSNDLIIKNPSEFKVTNSANATIFSVDPGSPGAVQVNGNFSVDSAQVTGGSIRLEEANLLGSNYIELKAPISVTSNVTLTFPDGAGTNGQVLQTNGSGTLTWTDRLSQTNPLVKGALSIERITVGNTPKIYIKGEDNLAGVALQAPEAIATDVTFTLPETDGTNGQALTTDGSGNLSFTTISGGGGGGGMTQTPFFQISGRVQWSTSAAGKRMTLGNTSYGAFNWYIHSQIVNGTAQTYSASDAVDTTTKTMANYYIYNAGTAMPSDSKKVRVKFAGRFNNAIANGSGTIGFSVWHCASMTSGSYASADTIRLIGKSADITPTTSSLVVWEEDFVSTTAYSGGRIMIFCEHRSGTLSATAYCYGNWAVFLE